MKLPGLHLLFKPGTSMPLQRLFHWSTRTPQAVSPLLQMVCASFLCSGGVGTAPVLSFGYFPFWGCWSKLDIAMKLHSRRLHRCFLSAAFPPDTEVEAELSAIVLSDRFGCPYLDWIKRILTFLSIGKRDRCNVTAFVRWCLNTEHYKHRASLV